MWKFLETCVITAILGAVLLVFGAGIASIWEWVLTNTAIQSLLDSVYVDQNIFLGIVLFLAIAFMLHSARD